MQGLGSAGEDLVEVVEPGFGELPDLGVALLVVGALESLWSSREEAWARDASQSGEFPDSKQRLSGVRAHERILKSIEDGDLDRVQRQARVHLESSMLYGLGADLDKLVEASPPRQTWDVGA